MIFNVIIQVGEDHHTKNFEHIRLFYKDNLITFNKPNINSLYLKNFFLILMNLKFEVIYIQVNLLDLTEQSGEIILELLIASDKLLLKELSKQV